MTNAGVAPERASSLIHVLFVIQLVSMGAMEMSGPFWPLHLKALSTSALEFDFAGVAVYVGPMLGTILTSAFWGRVGDRTGHKLMMVRALIGLALTQLALAWANDVGTILALRCIQGACAGYIAPAQTYGVSLVAPDRRARLFAYLQVSTNLGSLAGAVSGGLILDHATFFWINIGAAGLCAICAIAVMSILPSVHAAEAAPSKPSTPSVSSDSSKPSKPSEPSASFRYDGDNAASTWRSSPIFGLLGVVGILLVGRTIMQTPFSLYVGSTFSVSNGLVGLCYGMLSLGFVVSASLWARYFEHKPLAEALRCMLFVALACTLLTAGAGLTRQVGVFVAIHFVWGALLGATTPVLMSLISKAASGVHQGYVLGVAQSTAKLASVVGIALGGWLSDGLGLKYTYFFIASAYGLAAVVIMLLLRERGAAARLLTSPGR